MVQRHSGKFFIHPGSKGLAAGMFLFFAALFTGLQSYSQSFFYFENELTFPNRPTLTYYTFLTVTPDGSATARLRYIEPVSGDDRLLELQLVDSIMDNGSTDIRYLIAGEAPLLIKGNDDSGFVMPRFVFKKEGDGATAFYAPYATEYKVSEGNWNAASMKINQQKNIEELIHANDFVAHFFTETDEFYIYLFGEIVRAPNPVPRKEKLFLIVVANTLDSTIGITSKKDLVNITDLFTTMANNLAMKIITTKIYGQTFNKKSVELAIAKLNPTPIDIVIFYYSGHGFRYSNDTSKYPRISLRTSLQQNIDQHNLSIEAVYKRIVKKGAKVNIVLSDCCNDDIGSPVPVGRNLLRTKGGGGQPSINMENCRALFFPQHPLSILSSAAEKNQLATGNPSLGGFFTNFVNIGLTNSLYGYQPSTSWLRILLTAKEKARYQALTALCGSGRCVQLAEISVVPPQ